MTQFHLQQNRIINLIILFFIQIIAVCCHQNNNLQKNVEAEYYFNGRLKAFAVRRNDSCVQVFSFDTLGNCKDILISKNKVPNGEQLWFYKNGFLQQKTIYKSGKPDGFSYQYYPDGGVENYRFLIKGLEHDLGIDYYNMYVPVVKSSSYFNDSGKIYFKQNFDSLSNLINEEGKKPKELNH